jgi:hypothetical protein
MKNILKIVFMIAVVNFCCCDHNDKSKIETAIRRQLAQYPQSRLQDIYKNFYQDCFGTEHAISDTAAMWDYIENELQNTLPTPSSPMIDTLGWRHNFVRVNIDLVRQGKISAEILMEAFILSASKINAEDTENWINEWKTITNTIEEKHLPVMNYETDKPYIDRILQINPKAAMHHSKAFRQNYNPHYRVIEKSIFENMIEKHID